MALPRVSLLGDAALAVTFGDDFSEAVNEQVMALAASLGERPLEAAVRDVVPAIASLVVHLDPHGASPEAVREELRHRAVECVAPDRRDAARAAVARPIQEIPVRYGGADGPDLDDVAAFAGISAAEVIARHAARVYRVFMLGFLPGFAYLGEVDASIAAPRRSTPRQDVPAGSVGIAGRQTGVYPQVSPGGWQLIGRTAVSMFDLEAGRSRLAPGDRVRFVPERA